MIKRSIQIFSSTSDEEGYLKANETLVHDQYHLRRARKFLQKQDPSAVMFATGILLLVFILLLLYLDCRKPKGYPPGPKWLPILGSVLEVMRIRQKTGYLVHTCSVLCKKYGPVIGLRFGKDRMVLLNDLESIRTMLTDENCDGRPNGLMYKTRTFGVKLGLIVVDGPFWAEQRRFVLRHLRDFGLGRSTMATIVEYEAQQLVEHFRKRLHEGYDCEIINISKPVVSDKNAGQIYKLQKKLKSVNDFNIIENKSVYKSVSPTAADLYIKAEDYADIRRVSQSGMIITMHNAFGVSVLNTLWKMMAGKRIDTNDKELLHLQRIITNVLEKVDMIGAIFSYFPVLRYIAPEMSGYNSFLKTHQELWLFLQKELKNHKSTFISGEPRDLMDVYLAVLDSKDHSDTFSDAQLLSICIDLFIAGSETTSKSLAFAFLGITLFPEVQRKAQEEIDRVLGDKSPTLTDRPKLPYVQCIILEAMRFFMGHTLNVPHRAIKDTFIKGYKIPKDTMLIVNFNRIFFDESWGDPKSFRPERFLDDDGNIVIPEKFFPFSLSKHRCMGETLAKSNLFILTATLLQTFTFSVVPGEPRPSLDDVTDGVTAGPKPYRALVSLRT